MKGIYFFMIFIVLTACTAGPSKSPMSSDVFIDSTSLIPEDTLSHNLEKEETRCMYNPGKYSLQLDKGSIVLLIHAQSDTTCRFVFDTGKGTPHFAKLAGDLVVDQQGRATYSENNCKALDFHFTEAGISVKEFKCAQFHSEQIAFDGFYRTEQPKKDDPQMLLNQLQREEIEFDFYASFTEPFWTFYFIDDQVLINQMDENPKIYKLNHEFDPSKATQKLLFSGSDQKWEIVIEKGEGSDGMSEIIYPYHVIANGDHYGGGGTVFAKEQ